VNSQFIVTDFSILHAGGHYSYFKLVQSTRNAKFELAIAEATPFNYSARGAGQKRHIVTVFNMKYEIFWENLKIHAGGDDKLRIQFASPKRKAIYKSLAIK
jgi:hypothetical protein